MTKKDKLTLEYNYICHKIIHYCDKYFDICFNCHIAREVYRSELQKCVARKKEVLKEIYICDKIYDK